MSPCATIMSTVVMTIVIYEKCRIMTNIVMRNVVMRNVFMNTVVMRNTVAPSRDPIAHTLTALISSCKTATSTAGKL